MYVDVDGHKVFAAGRLAAASPVPPVVLVHGAAMDHTVWAMHTRYFMHVGRSVIAPDLPAHGRSNGEALPLTTPCVPVAAMISRAPKLRSVLQNN